MYVRVVDIVGSERGRGLCCLEEHIFVGRPLT